MPLIYTKRTNINCLRSFSSEVLNDTASYVYNTSYAMPGYSFGTFYFGLVVDGKFVRDYPSREFMPRNFYKVPLITDRNAYEGIGYSNGTDNGGTHVRNIRCMYFVPLSYLLLSSH